MLVEPFLTTGPLALVTINLLDPSKKISQGNIFSPMTIDRPFKMMRYISLRTTITATVTIAFLEYWVYAHCVPEYIQTDNGKQLFSQFLHSACTIFDSNLYLTTAYHP